MGKSAMAPTTRKSSATSAPRRPNPSGSERDGVASYGRIAKNRESCQMTKKSKVSDIAEHLVTDEELKALSEKVDAVMDKKSRGSRTKGPTGAASNYSRRDWNRSDKGKVGKPMRAPRGKGGEAWDERMEHVPENKPKNNDSN